MGESVEMRLFPVLGIVLFLAGCGVVGGDYAAVLSGLRPGAGGGPEGDGGFTATRESLAAAGFSDPLLVGRLESRGVRSGLFLAARNGPVTFWRAADGATVAERGGVMSATRGLGPDLWGAETEEVAAAVAADRGAEFARAYRHLDGLDQVAITRFRCRLTRGGAETVDVFGQRYATVRFDEVCRPVEAGGATVVNTYWRDADGPTMRRSRQWIGPDLGYFFLERMLD